MKTEITLPVPSWTLDDMKVSIDSDLVTRYGRATAVDEFRLVVGNSKLDMETAWMPLDQLLDLAHTILAAVSAIEKAHRSATIDVPLHTVPQSVFPPAPSRDSGLPLLT